MYNLCKNRLNKKKKKNCPSHTCFAMKIVVLFLCFQLIYSQNCEDILIEQGFFLIVFKLIFLLIDCENYKYNDCNCEW